MTHGQSEARSVALSTRIYAAMLRAYPAGFRAEYAEPMAQLFRDRCRAAHRTGGWSALVILWAHTLGDYLRTTIEEHASGGIQMTRELFQKLSGWALLIGAASLTIGLPAHSRPNYNPDNMNSLQIDRFANASGGFLIVSGFLLCALGMVGLLVRYGRAAGAWGRFGLGAGAFSALVAAVGVVIGTGSPDNPAAWPMFFSGMTFMFGGLLVFGVACIRRKLLPRWNALPLLAAVWLPSFALLGIASQALTGTILDLSAAASAVMLLASFGGLALLGYALLTAAETTYPQPGAA